MALGSKVLPVANPDTGGSLCYTTRRAVAWVRGTCLRKHFDRPLDTPESIVA